MNPADDRPRPLDGHIREHYARQRLSDRRIDELLALDRGPRATAPPASGPPTTGQLPSGPHPSGPPPSGPLPAGPLPAGPLPAGPLPAGQAPRSARRRWWIAAVAALLLIGLGPTTHRALMTELVAREGAMHHRRGIAPEIMSSDWATIGDALPRLPFRVTAPTRLPGWTLRGGRYCSVRGRLAVQLELEDPDGRVFSLYQTDGEGVLGRLDGAREISGLSIEQWQEGGLLHVLIGPAG